MNAGSRSFFSELAVGLMLQSLRSIAMTLDINFTWSFSIAFCNWSTFPETNRFSLSARRSTGAIGKLTIYFLLNVMGAGSVTIGTFGSSFFYRFRISKSLGTSMFTIN